MYSERMGFWGSRLAAFAAGSCGVFAGLILGGCLLTTPLDELTAGGNGSSSGAPADAGTDTKADEAADGGKVDAGPTNESSIELFRFVDVDTRAIPNGLDSITTDVTVKSSAIGNCTLEALTDPSVVGSVRFEVDGSEINVESSPPYYIVGDRGSTIYRWDPAPGTILVTATPYSQASAGGTKGKALSVRLTIQP